MHKSLKIERGRAYSVLQPASISLIRAHGTTKRPSNASNTPLVEQDGAFEQIIEESVQTPSKKSANRLLRGVATDQLSIISKKIGSLGEIGVQAALDNNPDKEKAMLGISDGNLNESDLGDGLTDA